MQSSDIRTGFHIQLMKIRTTIHGPGRQESSAVEIRRPENFSSAGR